jgi:hypothetical protein
MGWRRCAAGGEIEMREEWERKGNGGLGSARHGNDVQQLSILVQNIDVGSPTQLQIP